MLAELHEARALSEGLRAGRLDADDLPARRLVTARHASRVILKPDFAGSITAGPVPARLAKVVPVLMLG
jgi:hypothetical protein